MRIVYALVLTFTSSNHKACMQPSISKYRSTAQSLFPGVLVCVTIAAAAQFLSGHYGAPQMLFALLLGLAFHFLSDDKKTIPGVDFAASNILKGGIILLGFRITFNEIGQLDPRIVLLIGLGIVATILAGIGLSYTLGRRIRFGVLTGVAVSICGASAALAISAVLPASETKERDTLFTVVAVTTLSTLAMIVYPIIASVLGMTDEVAGIFMGATIHDVAQVVGAGYSVSAEAGDVATIFKLFRVALLVPVVLFFLVFFKSESKGGKLPTFPLFIIGFCTAVLLNSLNVIPSFLIEQLVILSRWCLVMGIVALGIKTSLSMLGSIGYTALSLIFAETVFLVLWVLAGLYLFEML